MSLGEDRKVAGVLKNVRKKRKVGTVAKMGMHNGIVVPVPNV